MGIASWKVFTATELAIVGNTSPQNISMHLGKLLDADLLCVKKTENSRAIIITGKGEKELCKQFKIVV